MGRERYVVRLDREELDQLEHLIRGGKSASWRRWIHPRVRCAVPADVPGGSPSEDSTIPSS